MTCLFPLLIPRLQVSHPAGRAQTGQLCHPQDQAELGLTLVPEQCDPAPSLSRQILRLLLDLASVSPTQLLLVSMHLTHEEDQQQYYHNYSSYIPNAAQVKAECCSVVEYMKCDS